MSRSFEGYLESRLVVTNITALWKKLCRKGGEQLCHLGRKLFTGVASVLILSQLCRAYDEQLDVADLINRAMQAQVAAQNNRARFQYVQKGLEKPGTRTYRIVETDVGAVERLVAINDNDLPPQQRVQEDQWLDKLLANPSIQKKRQKDDAEEEARRQKIIAVLGKAFLYDIEGTEDEGRIVRVHFTPNPKFHADSREAKVCAGLEGTMWI